MVPITAYVKIVQILSKNARLGKKYPASSIIGGKIYVKKTFGLKILSPMCSSVKDYSRAGNTL